MTRLQEVAREFIIADEALRKALLREEALRAQIAHMKRVMRAAQPQRVEVVGKYGREVWSLPIK